MNRSASTCRSAFFPSPASCVSSSASFSSTPAGVMRCWLVRISPSGETTVPLPTAYQISCSSPSTTPRTTIESWTTASMACPSIVGIRLSAMQAPEPAPRAGRPQSASREKLARWSLRVSSCQSYAVAPRIFRTPRTMEGTPEAGNAYRGLNPRSPHHGAVSSWVHRLGSRVMRRQTWQTWRTWQRWQRIQEPAPRPSLAAHGGADGSIGAHAARRSHGDR